MFGTLGTSVASPAALDEAIKILAVVSDPVAARAALDELKAALADLTARQADAVAKESANTAQLAQLVNSQQKQNQRSQDLDGREAAFRATFKPKLMLRRRRSTSVRVRSRPANWLPTIVRPSRRQMLLL